MASLQLCTRPASPAILAQGMATRAAAPRGAEQCKVRLAAGGAPRTGLARPGCQHQRTARGAAEASELDARLLRIPGGAPLPQRFRELVLAARDAAAAAQGGLAPAPLDLQLAPGRPTRLACSVLATLVQQQGCLRLLTARADADGGRHKCLFRLRLITRDALRHESWEDRPRRAGPRRRQEGHERVGHHLRATPG